MALDKKLDRLLTLKPDVAIVAESSAPEVMHRKRPDVVPASHLWQGRNRHKGLGVFAFGDYNLELESRYCQPENEIVLPIRVSGPVCFNLLAVWSFNDRGQPGRRTRPGPVLRALEVAADFCAEQTPLVIAGDFNNHTVWDRPGKPNNMASIFTTIETLGLTSAYHWSRRVPLGSEPEPTLFWRDRQRDGPSYHIDYIFVPRRWKKNGIALEVGGFDPWCAPGGSDHVPLLVDVHRI